MTRSRRSARLTAAALRLWGDSSAVMTVEFALVLPFMVVLLFGGIDVAEAVTARRKVAIAANTISDLIAQKRTVDQDFVTNAFNAGVAIMTPLDSGKLSTTVTSVVVDQNGAAKVAWSVAKNATARGKGDPFTLPTSLKAPGSSLIVAEVTFDYRPVVGYGLTGTLKMAELSYAQPRVARKDLGVSCTATGC
jgi:Flp pilus assembly protein TadG